MLSNQNMAPSFILAAC